MSILDKVFVRKRKIKKNDLNKEFRADISLYESTYEIPLIVLKLVGLRLTRNDSPFANTAWSVLYWWGMFNMFVAAILEMLYMVEVGKGGTFDDAVEIFRMMPCVGYLIMAQIKSYKIFVHRPVHENLVSELRSMWPTGPVTKEEHDLITKPIKRLNFILKGYYWCNHLLLALFIMPHVVDVVKRWLGYDVSVKLPFFFWLPFDPHKKIIYEFMLVLQSWEALVTVWLILCADLLFCVFMTHITTQFDLLAIRIRKMVYVPVDNQLIAEYPLARDCQKYFAKNRESIELNGALDWERKHIQELKEILLRHRALIRLSGDVEAMFSFQLLVNFFNSSIIICFCGFCCVTKSRPYATLPHRVARCSRVVQIEKIVEKLSEFIYKTFLATALTQTWLFCWYGQRLLESSAGVGDALYNSGWYLISTRVRNNVFIMLHRAQKRVHVTTYGFSIISLTSYTTIIKTAWSYFTLLLNAYKK